MHRTPSDIAFTDTVKAIQSAKGSRAGYAKMEEARPWAEALTPETAAFIAERDSAYIATASADGQPYIQHRGGPAGFLKVLDARTIGFADYAGNRQYVTMGNLAENPKAYLFLMDYANRRRLKIWGEARVVEDDPELLERLSSDGPGRPERAILFTVKAWDRNCPSHIPLLLHATEVAPLIAQRDARIAELEAEVAALRAK